MAARLSEAVEQQHARATHPAARGAAPGAAEPVHDAGEAEGDRAASKPRRRGHLVVYEGGRQLAG